MQKNPTNGIEFIDQEYLKDTVSGSIFNLVYNI